jgi:hypothetical protein
MHAMSEKAASEASEVRGELEKIAAELYALRPDDFAAARDEQVRKARADGQKALARELGQLRRPTQSAWLINALWRDERDATEQLLQLADDLARAQARGSGPDLLRLTARRRELEAALLRAARVLAEKARVNVTPAMEREVQETLSAALAQPDVADEIRTGCLVKPASYAGFGTFLPSAPPAATEPAPSARAKAAQAPRAPKEDATPEQPQSIEDARAARHARERREEAERDVEDARAAVEVAAEALAERGRAAEAAEDKHQAVRKQVEQLKRQLRELEQDLAASEDLASTAASRRDQADRAHQAALRTLGRAEEALRDSTTAEA